MDEFHEAAELMVFGAGVPAQSGTEEQQEGPDTLAAAIEDVCGDGIQMYRSRAIRSACRRARPNLRRPG